MYTFDLKDKLLRRIISPNNNNTITVSYNADKNPVAFRHSSGEKLTVRYDSNGLVREAEIRDGEEQTSSWYVLIFQPFRFPGSLSIFCAFSLSPDFYQNLLIFWCSSKIEDQIIQTKVDLGDKCGSEAQISFLF